jgi:[acyl-carrier-protein] S-malonyltransferase
LAKIFAPEVCYNPDMIAVIFPGQGSQKPGMGKEFFDAFDIARGVFAEVSDAVGRDISALCFESDEDELRKTQNAQIALYTCGVAAFRVLSSEAGIVPTAFAGHSVGEFAAVHCSGAISLSDGAKLVARRGALMANAPKGTMAAILGMEMADLKAVCESVGGFVVVANDNCPGQLVISGEISAVEKAGEKAKENGAKKVMPLNVSGAFHSPLMVQSGLHFAEALSSVTWTEQNFPVYANVIASAVTNSGKWTDLLQRQLASNVRWTESVQAMIAAGITDFIECGSGEVLTGLLKRIDKGVTGAACQDMASLTALTAK